MNYTTIVVYHFFLQSIFGLYCFIHDIIKMTSYWAKKIIIYLIFYLHLLMDNSTLCDSVSIISIFLFDSFTFSCICFIIININFIATLCDKKNFVAWVSIRDFRLYFFYHDICDKQLVLFLIPSMNHQPLYSFNLVFDLWNQ